MQKLITDLLSANDIDGDVLLKLTDQELKEDLKISSLGKRKKLLDEIKKLKRLSRRPRSTSNGLYSGTASNPRSEFHSSASTVSTEWSTSIATTTATLPSKPSIRTDFLDDSSIAEPPSMSGAPGNHFATGNADNSNSLTSTPTIAPEAMTLPSEAACIDSETLTPLLEKSTSFASAALTLVTEAKSSSDATLPMPSESKPSSSVLAEKTPSYSDITATSASTVTDGTTGVTTTSASADLTKLSTKEQLRPYQEELLMKIVKARQNVIVCGPTGSGKTLVAAKHCAAVLVKKWSESHEGKPKACIYFIVPTVHLVAQQAKYIEGNVDGVQVGQITGDQTEETTLYEQSQINDIVVMTPAILVNALKEKDSDVKLSNVPLLVLDECHHADKQHPYMQIMDFYLKQKLDEKAVGPLPRILGMTATLGVGSASTPKDAEDHVLTLCANLDSPEIARVTDHCNKLYQFVAHPDTELISASKRPMEDPFHLEIVKIMMQIQRKAMLPEKPYEHGSAEYETVINQHRHALEESRNHEALFYVRNLIAYNRGLQVYQDMRKEETLEFYNSRAFNHLDTPEPGGDAKLIRMMQNEKQNIMDQLQKIRACRSLQNPKLEKLKKLLLAEFDKSMKAKGIVFMKTREFTHSLIKWIDSDDDLRDKVRPMRLIGSDEMTKADQLNSIQNFDKGSCNLLVATTIGEEGLDIPECNFVIRYELVTSEIAEVQARGRARVRLQSSRFVEIVTRGSANEAHAKANKHREKLMNEASEAVRRLHGSELLNEIQKRQRERLKKVDSKARQLQTKRQNVNATDVKIECKQCGKDVCQASQVLLIDFHYVVPGEILDTKVRKERVTSESKYGKVGKIFCKNCSDEWGTLKQFGNGQEAPALKCEYLIFVVAGHGKAIKKWKDVPFEVQEGTEDDLLLDSDV
jgi:ERCC4-related helicase